MACPTATTLLLAVLLFTAISVSHGLTIHNLNIVQVRILGRVYCSVTGNPVVGVVSSGLVGVNVTIICNGGRTSLGQALTDPSGFFQVVLKTVDALLFDPSACAINVKLPVASCSVLPPTGNLQAIVSLLDVIQSALGAIAEFGNELFRLV